MKCISPSKRDRKGGLYLLKLSKNIGGNLEPSKPLLLLKNEWTTPTK